MAFKGKSTIELRNAETGELEFKTEDENMITNAAYNILNYHEKYKSVGGSTSQYNLQHQLKPLWKECFGGLLLFEKNNTEDVNNIFPSPSNKIIGHAANSYSGNNPYRGSLNESESKEINDGKGRRLVWDFATDKANGTIRSVSLTCHSGGVSGLFYDGVNEAILNENSRGWRYKVLRGLSNGDYTQPTLIYDKVDLPYSYNLISNSGFNPIGCFKENEYLLAKTNSSGDKSVTFVTKIVDVDTVGLNYSWKTTFTEKLITTTAQLVRCDKFSTDGENIYSVYPHDTNKLDIVIFKGDSLEIISENSYTVQDATFYSMASLTSSALDRECYGDAVYCNGYFYVLSSHSIYSGYTYYDRYYKINASDVSDYTIMDIGTKGSNSGNPSYKVRLFNCNNFLMIRPYTSSSGYYGFVEIENELRPCVLYNSYPPITSKIIPAPMMLNQTNSGFGICIMAPYMGTINNLSTPVVKNETQTMKVTYEITEI